MTKLTDKSPMPFGVHKGKAMVNVPSNYLAYLWNELWDRRPINNANGMDVYEYIKDNKEVIQRESGTKLKDL